MNRVVLQLKRIHISNTVLDSELNTWSLVNQVSEKLK